MIPSGVTGMGRDDAPTAIDVAAEPTRFPVFFAASVTRQPMPVLIGVAVVLLAALALVVQPETVRTVDPDGVVRVTQCGAEYFLFGTDAPGVTHACRTAFSGRAFGALVLMVGVGAIGALMTSLVQYWRGYALGELWSAADRRRRTTRIASIAAVPVVAVAALASGLAGIDGFYLVETDAVAFPPGVRDDAASETRPGVEPGAGENFVPQPRFESPALQPAAPLVALPAPAPPASAPPPASQPSTAPPAAAPAVPLTVARSAWFAARPNPVEAALVPDGGLPVASSGGSDAKHSFVTLTGTATVLFLAEIGGPGANHVPDQAVIQACRVTVEGWAEVRGGSFADEPDFDPTDCAVGSRSADGQWHFDLSRFADRSGDGGFAFVPAPGGGNVYQVTLDGTR